jgi:cytochrome c oxidase subunit II
MVVLMARVLTLTGAVLLGLITLVTVASARSWRAEQAATPAEQTVDIVAERFNFTPSEVKVPVGTKLTIRLTSDDTSHGFRIIGQGVDVEIPKRSRGTTTVTFTPEKSGRYTFECSRLCGAGHSFMRGEIVAEAPKGER